MMPAAAVLCGGLATRMYPITETIPKSLIDTDGQPFLFRQLRLLRSRGITRAVLCAGHLGEMIRDEAGTGAAFGLKIEYSFDGPVRLGTGGALKKALPLLGDEFFVLYGDSYLECSYADVFDAFSRSGADALMTVYRNDNRFDASNIIFENGRITAYDKANRTSAMHHIDYGLGILRRSVLEAVADGVPVDLAEIYGRLLAEGRLAGMEVTERFYEIGSPGGLEELVRHLRNGGHAE